MQSIKRRCFLKTTAAALFKKEPFDIGYIKIAQEMGVGCGDLKKIKIERVEV